MKAQVWVDRKIGKELEKERKEGKGRGRKQAVGSIIYPEIFIDEKRHGKK